MIFDALSDLGSGVLLAWVALPLLGLTISRAGRVDAASQFRAIALVLALASAVVLLPFARVVCGAAGVVALPKDVERELLAAREPIALGRTGHLSLLGAIAIAWLAVAALAAAREVARAVIVAGVARRAAEGPATLRRRLAVLADAEGMDAPRVRVSDECSVPFTAGVLSPVIVIPRALAATFDARSLELILRHELAHVARRDVLASLLLAAPRALFALHPAATTLYADLRLARELAVDARVAAVDPCAYPKVLLDVACHARFGRRLYEAVGMHRTDLAQRLDALGDASPRKRARWVPATVVASLLAASVFVAPTIRAACPMTSTHCHPPCTHARVRGA